MSPSPDVKSTVDGLHEDLLDQIAALRCAYHVISAVEDQHGGEDLPAARSLLYRAIQTIDQIDNRIDRLSVELAHTPKPTPLRLVPEPEPA